jgi:heme oxygenase (biliverdin-IX-beta and delta-forming)
MLDGTLDVSGPKTPTIDPRRRTGTPVSARHKLRIATAASHAELDALLSAFDLETLPQYRSFLEINAAALLPVESALVEAGVGRLFPDWRFRARSAAILHDLARVGGGVRPLPPPNDLTRHLTDDGIIGTMYVLEGSRLGAKVLLRRIAESGDNVVKGAVAYLRHGEGQNFWQGYLNALEDYARQGGNVSDAIEAARRAFSFFMEAAASR